MWTFYKPVGIDDVRGGGLWVVRGNRWIDGVHWFSEWLIVECGRSVLCFLGRTGTGGGNAWGGIGCLPSVVQQRIADSLRGAFVSYGGRISDRGTCGTSMVDNPVGTGGGVRVGISDRMRNKPGGDDERAVLRDVRGETVYRGIDDLQFRDVDVERVHALLHGHASGGLAGAVCALVGDVVHRADPDHRGAGGEAFPGIAVPMGLSVGLAADTRARVFRGRGVFWVSGGAFAGTRGDDRGEQVFRGATNAAMTVATSLSNHCNTLNACLQGAFLPAITNACGARDYGRMLALTYRTCKIGTSLVLLFALPLALEVEEVLRLWLKRPPEHAAGLSLFMLATLVIDRLGRGSMIALNANGKVMAYQVVSGSLLILTFPAAWLFVALGWGVYSIGWAFVIFIAAHILSAIWFARKLVRFSFRYWIGHIVLPCATLTAICGAMGLLPRLWLEASLLRVAATTLCCEAALLPLAWVLVLSREERIFVQDKLRQMIGRLTERK